METFSGLDNRGKLACVVGGVTVAVVSAVVVKKLTSRKPKKVSPPNTVILHGAGRGTSSPSLSPFALKLETYLRMANIPYENDNSYVLSSKGKCPWIEYNGEAIADSLFCVDYLNKKFDVDLNQHLSRAEQGVAWAIQVMAEEHLFWCMVLFRWQYDNDKSVIRNAFNIGRFFAWMIRRQCRKITWAQGLGRHTEEEVTQIMNRDLQAISDVLGTKKFLGGDKVCEADCAVFGQLAEIKWQFHGTGHEKIIRDKYPVLDAYCERMKDTFWPDWDQCTIYAEASK